MTTRRGFLGSILALAAAPAIVRADSLMRVVPVATEILPVTELVVTTTMGSRLLTLDEISRAALQMAHQQFKFINTINVRTDEAFDPYSDKTHYQTRILVNGCPERKPQGDTIRIRMPNRYFPQ